MGMGTRWGRSTRAMQALMILAAVTLAACSGTKKNVRATDPDAPYRIGREDVIDVSVWRDADLSRTLAVRPDGYISMPLIGEVKAEGMTAPELSQALARALQPMVQEPRVSVIVREFNSSRVFITGEVARPGAYPIRGRVSVLQAIALAGGFSDFADRDAILVIRSGKDGGQIPVSYSEILDQESESTRDVLLQPGDTILVP